MTPEIVELRTEFFQRLWPVRRRLRAAQLLSAIGQCLLPATLFAIVLFTLRFACGYPSAWIVGAAALVPLILATAWGLTRDIDWPAVARATDQSYALADRTLSALANFQQFERDLRLSPTAVLQLRDAVHQLEQVQARDVVRLRMTGRTGSLLLLLVLVLMADVVIPPEKLAGEPAAFVGGSALSNDSQPAAADSPLALAPPDLLTQPVPGGRSAGPLERQQGQMGSYLGDNAATERYFEQMDRQSSSALPSPSLPSSAPRPPGGKP